MHDKQEEQNQLNRTMLNKAIKESLLSLGEAIMNTILWHMRQRGFILNDAVDTDIDIFFNYLSEIVGDVADVVMTDVYNNLEAQCIPQLSKGNNLLLLSRPSYDDPDGTRKNANIKFRHDDELETKEKIRLLLTSMKTEDADRNEHENSEVTRR